MRATLPQGLYPWLRDSGSLTSRIVARSGVFEVRLLRQHLGRPMPDERALFRVRRGALVWVREVLLVADGHVVVYARSVLPWRSLRGPWHVFDRIGARSLGEALFADPRIRRQVLSSSCLKRNDARYHRAVEAAALVAPPARLWARRSLFRLRGRELLVTEIFLPAILDLPA